MTSANSANSANSTNTVIMVWMQDPASGLGDLLRGTVYLCELSQQLNFRLIVDTQLHPVSHFLVSTAHEYSEYVRQNKHRVLNLVNAANSASAIRQCVTAKTVDPILLIANPTDNMHARPSARAVALIRTILTPTDDFKAQFSAMWMTTPASFRIPPRSSSIWARFVRTWRIASFRPRPCICRIPPTRTCTGSRTRCLICFC